MIRTFLTNYYKLLLPVLVIVVSILFQDKLQHYYSTYIKLNANGTYDRSGIFSAERLAQFNGVIEKNLYISVLGTVYDVSNAKKNYAKGSPYHYFVGKDGTRVLATGDFKDESENKDHTLDLPCADILTIIQWKESFEKKYKIVGVITGRYYGNDGRKTPYLLEFSKRIEECISQKEASKKQDLKYPPCNIEWSENEGTKVWCTKTSGGINREWVGVPRQLYTPGVQQPRCVCINTDVQPDTSVGLFKEYENCANTSVMCFVNS